MIAVAAAAAFLATFNETFLNVAFTPIMNDFGVDVNTVQWLTTGYLLVAAVFVPVSHVLYHRFPTRQLFVSVVAIMVVGSVVGALAPSFEVLLIARLLQAIGTGLLTPIGMNVTLAVSPREKLGLNMGIMAAMTTLGPSLAIVLSGVLLTFAPWTTLLWVFGALTLLVLIAGAIALRTVADLGRPVLDIPSFLLVAVGLVGILYGISAAFGGAPVYAALSASIGLAALWVFVVRQRRIVHPLIDMRPFSNRAFVLGVSMTMLGLVFVFAMNVVIPLFLQAAQASRSRAAWARRWPPASTAPSPAPTSTPGATSSSPCSRASAAPSVSSSSSPSSGSRWRSPRTGRRAPPARRRPRPGRAPSTPSSRS